MKTFYKTAIALCVLCQFCYSPLNQFQHLITPQLHHRHRITGSCSFSGYSFIGTGQTAPQTQS